MLCGNLSTELQQVNRQSAAVSRIFSKALPNDRAAGLSLRTGKKEIGFITPTETNVHGDARCFMVMGPFLLQRLAVGGSWQLVVGGWWRLAVGCWWRLVAVGGGWWRLAVGGGWRLVVGGPWGLSLRAVLNKTNIWLLKDSPAELVG